MTGTLTLAATPIGNPADAGRRLTDALARADVVAAEDTRRLRRLVSDLGVSVGGEVVSYFDGNEAARTEMLLGRLLGGESVLVVSDAGMPTISDPGHRLVAACVDADVPVTVIPGPSAVLAALAVSGLDCERFTFEGFPPRKSGRRTAALTALADESRTMVFFESPRRVAATLADMSAVFGQERPAALCRELTKTHEEVLRGSLEDLLVRAEQGILGEVVLVVGGAVAGDELREDQLAELVADLMSKGMKRRDAAAEVALRTGASRRAAYEASLS